MKYVAWVFFLALTIIGIFILVPQQKDAKVTERTEEAAPETTSQKQEGDASQNRTEEAKDKPEDNPAQDV